ncbi:MAG: secondary thiamine-phosphate synthase enzyme YjbQ [Candidatus Undinarchaeales archaeon]
MDLKVNSESRVDLIDLTDRLEPEIEEGILIVYSPHTTTGLFINENETNLRLDIKKMLKTVVKKGGWKHDNQEGNADSHLRGILLGNSVVVPVSKGKLDLGTWQSVFFAELDGPRTRKVVVKELKS